LPPAICAPDWMTTPEPPPVPSSDGNWMVKGLPGWLTLLSWSGIAPGLIWAADAICTVEGAPVDTCTSVPRVASSVW
jgi:hypothetical protein